MAMLPLAAAAALWSAMAAAPQPAPPQGDALSDAEGRALVQRAIRMQHQSDEALELFDRTERIVDREDEKSSDTTVRTVPVGAGVERIEVHRDGQAVPQEQIAQKWTYVLAVMESRMRTGDPAVKSAYERAAKRKEYSSKMVDAIGEAFRFRWEGRGMRAGRPVIELSYEPAPQFKPRLRFSNVYRQVYGKVWIDEASGYVVRLEADLRKDIPIGGGIVGKIYKGARVEIEQAEAYPGAGVWLPTLSSYDIKGRKFLFPASYHRQLYASEYRRIGPPAEALALLRNEHARAAAPENPAR